MREDTHKIVFKDGEITKVIRGKIIKEDDFFIYLQHLEAGELGKDQSLK